MVHFKKRIRINGNVQITSPFAPPPNVTPVCEQLNPAYTVDVHASGVGILFLTFPTTPPSINVPTLQIPGVSPLSYISTYTSSYTSSYLSSLPPNTIAIPVIGTVKIEDVQLTQVCSLGLAVKIEEEVTGIIPVPSQITVKMVEETGKELVISVSNGVISAVTNVTESLQYISNIIHIGAGSCFSIFGDDTISSVTIQDYDPITQTTVGSPTTLTFVNGEYPKPLRSLTGYIAILAVNGSGNITIRTFECG